MASVKHAGIMNHANISPGLRDMKFEVRGAIYYAVSSDGVPSCRVTQEVLVRRAHNIRTCTDEGLKYLLISSALRPIMFVGLVLMVYLKEKASSSSIRKTIYFVSLGRL